MSHPVSLHSVSPFLCNPDADHKVCGGGRWCRGEDLSADLLHHQQVPLRICAHGERKTKHVKAGLNRGGIEVRGEPWTS